MMTLMMLAVGVVSGAVVALRYIAPRTATKKDDAVLALLERVMPFLPADKAAEAQKLLKK